MVKQLSDCFTMDERECLMRAIVKLNDFFKKSLESSEDKQ
jgi:hypothetical protein